MPVYLSPHSHRVSEILLQIGAIHFCPQRPFIFTSGSYSPVYVNCRRIIATTHERRQIVQFMAQQVEATIGSQPFDLIAGGETAGIPFAAWLCDYFYKPMVYVRKRTKDFGLRAQIEGCIDPGQRVLLVEDLMTDGASKAHFCSALRRSGALVHNALVVFNYGVFANTDQLLTDTSLTVHALTDWNTTIDVAEIENALSGDTLQAVRAYLKDPQRWSLEHGEGNERR